MLRGALLAGTMLALMLLQLGCVWRGGLGQGSGTGVWDRGLGQGSGTGVWDRGLGQQGASRVSAKEQDIGLGVGAVGWRVVGWGRNRDRKTYVRTIVFVYVATAVRIQVTHFQSPGSMALP